MTDQLKQQFLSAAENIKERIFDLIEQPTLSENDLDDLENKLKAWYSPEVQNAFTFSENPPKTSRQGYGFVTYAVNLNNTPALNAMVAAKANLNEWSENGMTPLTLATDLGKMDILKLLIHAGADLDQANDAGDTPLTTAALTGNVEIFKELVSGGANLYQEDNNGYTPLNAAIKYDRPQIIEALDALGVDVSFPSEEDEADCKNSSPAAYRKIKEIMAPRIYATALNAFGLPVLMP